MVYMVSVLEQCKLVCHPNPLARSDAVCMVRIRNTFYNKSLFDYSPQMVEVALTTRPKADSARIRIHFGGHLLDFVLNFMMTLSILVTLLYFLPGVLDRLIPGRINLGRESSVMEETLASVSYTSSDLLMMPETTVSTPIPAIPEVTDLTHRVQPEYDLTLPEGRWIVSESAGIKAPIYTNNDIADTKVVDDILDRGIYLYPQYNSIGWSGREVILAGHHYNMNISEQKRQQSFQNLEKLQVGDRVQIVDDYKIWTYEIYKIEQSTEITEQNPDLMMYTCIFWWDAKLRLFVYANIVE